MKIEIYYDPDSDTLDVGNGQTALEAYDVADGLTVHLDRDGDVVFISIDHAAELLAPFLLEQMAEKSNKSAYVANGLRDSE